MSGKPKKPLEPLIPLDELKKVVSELIAPAKTITEEQRMATEPSKKKD